MHICVCVCVSIREWCLKVTLPNLPAAAGVLNVNLEKKEKKIYIYIYSQENAMLFYILLFSFYT